MGNPQTSLVAAPLETQIPGSHGISQALEQPRDFHFAVTWVTLFAHLDLAESRGPRPKQTVASSMALVPVVVAPAPLVPQSANYDPNAAWEMVVPKMIRTDTGEFTPAESGTGS